MKKKSYMDAVMEKAPMKMEKAPKKGKMKKKASGKSSKKGC